MAPNTENMKKDLTDFSEAVDHKEIIKLEQPLPTKSSVILNLGSYNASVLPLGILTFTYLFSLAGSYNIPEHPLTKGLFLLNSSPFLFTFVCVYILFSTVWGPRLMKNREAIKMKSTIKYYNIFQILICSYMVYEFAASGWVGNYNYFCENLTYDTGPDDARITSVVYIYYLTKILDFLDTIFFVLNKKSENVSVLHLVHHSTMAINLWFGSVYIPTGQITFAMFFNSFIHVVMYGYYFLSSLGPAVRPYLWWKKYLTTLQIIQLITIFIHLSQVYFNGCKAALALMAVPLICDCIYITLFLDFYMNSYSQKMSKPKNKTQESNGILNGTSHLKQG